MIPPLGAFGVVRTNGWAALGIRLVTGSSVNHAFVYVGSEQIVEANPEGTDVCPLSEFPDAIWSGPTRRERRRDRCGCAEPRRHALVVGRRRLHRTGQALWLARPREHPEATEPARPAHVLPARRPGYCGGDIELHHMHVEFSQQADADREKVNRALGLHIDDDEAFARWIESPGNLEALCVNHHPTHFGVHTLPHALWEADRWRKAGTRSGAEVITSTEWNQGRRA